MLFGQDIYHGYWIQRWLPNMAYPQAMNALFNKIESLQHQLEFQLHVSFIEVIFWILQRNSKLRGL
uniref:Uncharacterized protein n=1 Tax=Helianthus annuus TaxID=4232 RepID=A0A251T7H2_HELAN